MRSQSNSQPITSITELRPTIRVSIITASPACVPATLSKPARAP